jgi:DNA invertase Pin-like site-specific DNA recombinase
MSTEHQRYSLENQAAAIAIYAAAKGFDVVKTYADAGRSGLRIKGRDALRALLADVIGGDPGFDTILVLDVSRWGRFQDTDESAHYEFLCRSAGVQVRYCAEMFENDGSLTSTIVKSLKRAMAAEYSRELSAKVVVGLRRAATEGRWLGGPPSYGLRRMLLDENGRELGIMAAGQRKSIQSHKVVLVAGPPEEVEIVRRIYRLYVDDRLSVKAIARRLNDDDVPTGLSRPWTPALVRTVLSRESYAGVLVSGRTSTRLGAFNRNPPEQWVRAPGAAPRIITAETYEAAQRLRESRGRPHQTDEALLKRLTEILRDRGRLSPTIVKEAAGAGARQTYERRFGRWSKLYELIGYVQKPAPRPTRLDPYKQRLSELLAGHPREYGFIRALWRRLESEGYRGGYEPVRDYIHTFPMPPGGRVFIKAPRRSEASRSAGHAPTAQIYPAISRNGELRDNSVEFNDLRSLISSQARRAPALAHGADHAPHHEGTGLMDDEKRSDVVLRPTDEELLEELRQLLAERGKLTMSLIEASQRTRSPNTYIRRFGSLTAAYARIGYGMSERQRAAADRFRSSR